MWQKFLCVQDHLCPIYVNMEQKKMTTPAPTNTAVPAVVKPASVKSSSASLSNNVQPKSILKRPTIPTPAALAPSQSSQPSKLVSKLPVDPDIESEDEDVNEIHRVVTLFHTFADGKGMWNDDRLVKECKQKGALKELIVRKILISNTGTVGQFYKIKCEHGYTLGAFRGGVDTTDAVERVNTWSHDLPPSVFELVPLNGGIVQGAICLEIELIYEE